MSLFLLQYIRKEPILWLHLTGQLMERLIHKHWHIIVRFFRFSVVASLLFYVLRVLIGEQLVFDDAYMFVRYAENILAGYGFTWNPGEAPTYGCTSVLYTYWIVGLRWVFPYALPKDLIVGSTVMWGIAGLYALVACIRYAMQSDALRNWIVVAGIVFPYLIFDPIYWFHATSGMETLMAFTFYCGLIGVVYAFGNRMNGIRMGALVGIAYACFLIRPDSGIIIVLFPCLYMIWEKRSFRWAILYGLLLGGVLIVDSWVKYRVFGDPLPLPFYAKKSGFYDGYIGGYQWNAVKFLLQFLLVNVPALVGIALFIQPKHCRMAGVLGIPILLTFGYYFTVMQIMGGGFRYYFPTIPFLTVFAFICWDDWIRNSMDTLKVRLQKRGLLIVGAMVLIGIFSRPGIDLYQQLFLDEQAWEEADPSIQATKPLPELSWWEATDAIYAICRDLPDSLTIAASEYGYIGAGNRQLYILDMVGLHDPVIAHQGFSACYIFEQAPELIWFPHSHYTRIRHELVSHPSFGTTYHYIPQAYGYGLAVRKDAIAAWEVVQTHWKEVYADYPLAAYIQLGKERR